MFVCYVLSVNIFIFSISFTYSNSCTIRKKGMASRERGSSNKSNEAIARSNGSEAQELKAHMLRKGKFEEHTLEAHVHEEDETEECRLENILARHMPGRG